MIRRCTGDLLLADAEALVNPVNTVGVMGKGLALSFREAYPAMYASYVTACAEGRVQVGLMSVWHTEQGHLGGNQRFVVNFPTKVHWLDPSRLEYIRDGLVDLTAMVAYLNLSSIAIPPLGCGLGGLGWADVEPMITGAFSGLPEVDVLLYAP